MNINCNVSADTLALSPRILAARPGAQRDAVPTKAAAPMTANDPSLLAATEKVTPVVGPFTNADVQQLTANWGQGNSQYDLDGNGTVDIDDLLLMLSQIQAEPEPAPATPPAEVAAALTAEDPAATIDPGAASSEGSSPVSSTPAGGSGSPDIEQLLAQWGQTSSRFDLDGSGVVGIDDLLMMISNLQTPSVIECSPAILAAGDGQERGDALQNAREKQETERADGARSERGSERLGAGGLGSLSASLIDRLVAAGFGDRPPSNLRDVVDKLDLHPGDQRQVLAALNRRYPQGLGVSLRA